MDTAPHELTGLLGEKDFPPQQAFSFSRQSWIKWLGHIDGMSDFLSELPESLDRLATAEIAKRSLREFPAGAFAAAMIWGYGQAGYGPYRTAYVLTGSREHQGAPLSPENVGRLARAARLAQESGAGSGYRYLINRPGKLPGLGPAFFTKWLYFVTTQDGRNSQGTAPVLDQLIIRWLRSKASIHLKPARTAEYERYIETLQPDSCHF